MYCCWTLYWGQVSFSLRSVFLLNNWDVKKSSLLSCKILWLIVNNLFSFYGPMSNKSIKSLCSPDTGGYETIFHMVFNKTIFHMFWHPDEASCKLFIYELLSMGAIWYKVDCSGSFVPLKNMVSNWFTSKFPLTCSWMRKQVNVCEWENKLVNTWHNNTIAVLQYYSILLILKYPNPVLLAICYDISGAFL